MTHVAKLCNIDTYNRTYHVCKILREKLSDFYYDQWHGNIYFLALTIIEDNNVHHSVKIKAVRNSYFYSDTKCRTVYKIGRTTNDPAKRIAAVIKEYNAVAVDIIGLVSVEKSRLNYIETKILQNFWEYKLKLYINNKEKKESFEFVEEFPDMFFGYVSNFVYGIREIHRSDEISLRNIQLKIRHCTKISTKKPIVKPIVKPKVTFIALEDFGKDETMHEVEICLDIFNDFKLSDFNNGINKSNDEYCDVAGLTQMINRLVII